MAKTFWITLTVFLSLAFSVSAVQNCWDYDGNQTACQSLNYCNWFPDDFAPGPDNGWCDEIECWNYNDQTACETGAGCIWKTSSGGSWCEELSCYTADFTNQTNCEATLNQTNGLECVWTAGPNLCDPLFTHSDCSDFDGNELGCYDTYYCEWNGTSCLEPAFTDFGDNPPCAVLPVQDLCEKIIGCSWTGSFCTGLDQGIACTDINESDFCNNIPMLSTCCEWSGGSCNATFSPACYDNMQPPPLGASFCEDYNSFQNQTLCTQIAASPWYMPCMWDNTTSECHFNGDAFFGSGGGGFDDITSKGSCESAGGIWQSETYVDFDGITRTDSWCEFGFVGNCDASCWACEYQQDGSAWGSSTAAQTACQNSATGYCQFNADTNAINGLGWCDPADQFFTGGGNCDSNCRDCDFMNAPQTACDASPAQCKWLTDPSDNTIGWCEKANAKTCTDDCFSCYDQTNCETYGNGGNNSCEWDINYYCKPAGFSGEVCFDSIDNDGNGLFDCADPACGFDTFCGGQLLGNCGVYGDQSSCQAATTLFGNCVWLTDDWGSWCGMPGEQCWELDDNQTECDAASGCGWDTGNGGFCEVNVTQDDGCENYNPTNKTVCEADPNCMFSPDPWDPQGGWCEHAQWECEWNATLQINQTVCESNPNCAWDDFPWFGEPPCGPKCWDYDDNQTACGQASACEWVTGLCEPDFFLGSCPEFDNTNQTACEANPQCKWINPICEDIFMLQMFDGMEAGPPSILGIDGDDGLEPQIDIMGFGLKDMGEAYGLGIMVEDISTTALCNGFPLIQGGTGAGTDVAKFYWYVDTDGIETGGCSAIGVSQNYTGFEFLFTYESVYDTQNNDTLETRVAYRCISPNWAPINVPVSGDNFRMCDEIGGGMVAVEKEGMEKFSELINDTANLRFFSTTANDSTNRLSPQDQVGPSYFTPGSVDFAFEDCSAKGFDFDGDGFPAENDPDCVDFFKFGYIPIEAGPLCGDSIDNDNNGLTDCADTSCSYDPYFCGGSLTADPNDKTAPQLVWLEKNLYPDGAFVMFDTNEPTNGTILFYGTDTSCVILNKTVRDVGLVDSFIPAFRTWHDASIDNFPGNPDALGWSLTNGTTYNFKTQNCDPSGNCALSKCINFTTRPSFSQCTDCQATFKFDYEPPTNTQVTDPLGNLHIKVIWGDGTVQEQGASALSANYTKATNATLVLSNHNSTTPWEIKLKEANLQKLSQSAKNLTAGDIKFTEAGNTFVGLDNDLCQKLIQELRPAKLEISIPGNLTELWQCDDGLNTCVNKTPDAIRILYNTTQDFTIWEVPSSWGC